MIRGGEPPRRCQQCPAERQALGIVNLLKIAIECLSLEGI